mmetsp:Transcript_26123/g.62147  ORF Transcript_26123/g.62147 Transcript_26123/m.62147 type:complete len:225 (-) Transcript_26123:112-786(-)
MASRLRVDLMCRRRWTFGRMLDRSPSCSSSCSTAAEREAPAGLSASAIRRFSRCSSCRLSRSAPSALSWDPSSSLHICMSSRVYSTTSSQSRHVASNDIAAAFATHCRTKTPSTDRGERSAGLSGSSRPSSALPSAIIPRMSMKNCMRSSGEEIICRDFRISFAKREPSCPGNDAAIRCRVMLSGGLRVELTLTLFSSCRRKFKELCVTPLFISQSLGAHIFTS